MLYNIQALRAVAATLVVWAHLKEIFPDTEAISFLPSGFAGVDLFFVISGFIMVASTIDRDVTPASFLAKRLIRVAPLYYVFTIAVFLLTLLAPSVLKSSVADPAQLAASFAFFPVFKTPDRIYPLYYLGWTLNYEMFFYLVFSIGLFLKGAARYAVPVAIIAVLAAIGFAHDFSGVSAALYSFTRPILLDFVLGMLIALSIPGLKTWGSTSPASVVAVLAVGIVGLGAGQAIMPQVAAFALIAPQTGTILTFGIWSAMTVAAAVALELSGIHVRNRLVLMVGDASYSLYLSHFFVVAVAIVICNRLNAGLELRVVVAIATFVACIAVAIACYYLLERTLLSLFRSRVAKAVA